MIISNLPPPNFIIHVVDTQAVVLLFSHPPLVAVHTTQAPLATTQVLRKDFSLRITRIMHPEAINFLDSYLTNPTLKLRKPPFKVVVMLNVICHRSFITFRQLKMTRFKIYPARLQTSINWFLMMLKVWMPLCYA